MDELPPLPVEPTSLMVPVDMTETEPFNVIQLSTANSLRELEKDFVFFSHGVYVIQGKLVCDPVRLYFSEKRPDRSPYFLVSEKKIFSGISPFFDSVLTVVERDCWPELMRYLDSVVVIDLEKRFFAKALRQRLPLFDFYALEKFGASRPPYPTIEIVTYSLTSNERLWHFKPAKSPGQTIKLCSDEPEQEVIVEANMRFGLGLDGLGL